MRRSSSNRYAGSGAAVVRAVLVLEHVVSFVSVVYNEDASGSGCAGGGCGGNGADGGTVDGAGGDAGGAFGDFVAGDVLDGFRCASDDPAEVGVREDIYAAYFCGCG